MMEVLNHQMDSTMKTGIMTLVREGDMNNRTIGTDDKENEAIVLELIGQTVEQLINDNTITSNNVKQHLQKHFDWTLKQYLVFRDSTQPRQWEKFKGLLIAELKNAFRNFCLDLTSKYSPSLSKAVLSFRSEVDSQVKSECQPLEHLQNILSVVKTSVLQQFENSVPDYIEQLKNRLDQEVLVFISENNKRLGVLYREFNSILPDLLSLYEDVVDLALSDEDAQNASDEKLESAFKKCQKAVLKKFRGAITFDVQEIKEMFENRLITILREQFAEKINLSKSHREQKLAEAAAIVTEGVDIFTNSMSEMFEKSFDESVIDNVRREKCKDLIMSMTDKMYEILSDRTSAKQMLENAQQKMEDIFQEMKTERHMQIQKREKRFEAELNSIGNEFEIKLNELTNANVLSGMEQMRTNRDIIISEMIRKINISWLGEQKNKNLLNSYRNAAKDRMNNLSIPILASYEMVLKNVFEQQKCLMNCCLEEHEIKVKELLRGELNDEAIANVRSVGAKSVEQFNIKIKQIVPACESKITELRNNLRQAISKVEMTFEKQVRERQLIIKAEIGQLITDSVNDYKHLMNAFSIASNYEKDKITQIHDSLKTRAEQDMLKNLKLVKYSGNTKEHQRELETLIDKSYSDFKIAIDNQQDKWNQKLESCNQKANNHYKQLFNGSMGLVQNEEDLKKMHLNLKEQAIALWEESFPIDYFGHILLPERRKFSKQLDNDLETSSLHMWQQINLDIDRNTRSTIEDLVKKYEDEMNSTLNEFNYISADMILSNHEKFAKEAKTSLNTVNKPKNISKKTYDDLLSSRLVNTLDCIKEQNEQRKASLQVDLSNQIHHLKELIRRELLNLKVFPGTTELLNTYRVKVEQFLREYKVPGNCRKELHAFAEEKLMDTLQTAEEEWDKAQPDPNELQLSINRAVDEYNREMDNRTSKTGEVFVTSAMNKHHAFALDIVQKKFQDNIKQTSAVRNQFNKAIEGVFKKFEDLNDLRAAENNDAAVGIDLGTTFSCVAVYKGEKIEMIPDREHHSNTVPSYVFYENATKTVVGHSAKDQSLIHPHNVIFDSKRLIGRKFNDRQTQKDITQWPFKVVKDPAREAPKIEVHEKTFHPEEVSGEILKHLKSNAELYLGREVKDVVITVPAYFNDAQKRSTKNAAIFANMNVLEIINEPTSAAIAYSLHYTDGKNKNILVFDLGGGTFDVSVLSTEKCNIVVKAVGGDNHLGGEDFDSNMVDFCIEKFYQETGLTIPKNSSSAATCTNDKNQTIKTYEVLRRLRQKCERAKINLSKTDKVHVVIDYILNETHMDIEVTVNDFNEMNKLLFTKCIEIVKDTVENSNLTKEQIDDVVLVGGSSRIPEVQRLLSEYFDGKSLIMSLNPDEVVAQGAAYRAAMISGSKSRKLEDIKFQDVNPLSLGVEVIGKKFSIIIPKNTPLPVERTETYHTAYDYQTKILFSIYEGEDLLVKNNNLLGEFTLSNIPYKKRGQEPVDVTIKCDGEGLIHVTAKVRSNASSGDIKIQSNRGDLTEEDIRKAMSK